MVLKRASCLTQMIAHRVVHSTQCWHLLMLLFVLCADVGVECICLRSSCSIFPVPNRECRNAALLKKSFNQLLDLSPLIPPADLQLSGEVLFLGGQGGICWALVRAFLIQHSVSAEPQRTLRVLHEVELQQ